MVFYFSDKNNESRDIQYHNSFSRINNFKNVMLTYKLMLKNESFVIKMPLMKMVISSLTKRNCLIYKKKK